MRRRILVAATIAVLGLTTTPAVATAVDYGAPGTHPVATTNVTAAHAGRSVPAQVHYPATTAGTDRPVAQGTFPVIAFGHGFVQATSKYTSTVRHLASWGFVVIVPTTQGGPFPSHSAFADDLNTALTWMTTQHTTAGSRFQGHIAVTALGLSGHSMGGGAAILAAARNSRVSAISTTAAAETNPSAKAAAPTVQAPAQFVAAQQDNIAPINDHQRPIYAAKRAPKQLRTITGGFHCGFIDTSSFFCDSGSITRQAQLTTTRRVTTAWFRHYLSGDTAALDHVWGQAARQDPAVVFEGSQ